LQGLCQTSKLCENAVGKEEKKSTSKAKPEDDRKEKINKRAKPQANRKEKIHT
jgi:hypothetical protein